MRRPATMGGGLAGLMLLLPAHRVACLSMSLRGHVHLRPHGTDYPCTSRWLRGRRGPRSLVVRPVVGSTTDAEMNESLQQLQQRERQGADTLKRVVLPTLAAFALGVLTYTPICLIIKSFLDQGQLSILANDSSQFMQNFLTVNGLMFSILAGNSFYFLYVQTEALYYALFAEVSEAKSLLEQTTLVCQGRPFYRDVLRNIKAYVSQDLRRLDLPPAVLLSRKPSNDPLESILYMTSVGVPSVVYETVKSLRAARGYRLGASQRKLPEIHFYLFYFLGFLELAAFPLLGAGTSSLFTNSILSVQSFLFGLMTASVMMTIRVTRELWAPMGGAYNVDAVLSTMVQGLESELDARMSGGSFSQNMLPSPPPSYAGKVEMADMPSYAGNIEMGYDTASQDAVLVVPASTPTVSTSPTMLGAQASPRLRRSYLSRVRNAGTSLKSKVLRRQNR